MNKTQKTANLAAHIEALLTDIDNREAAFKSTRLSAQSKKIKTEIWWDNFARGFTIFSSLTGVALLFSLLPLGEYSETALTYAIFGIATYTASTLGAAIITSFYWLQLIYRQYMPQNVEQKTTSRKEKLPLEEKNNLEIPYSLISPESRKNKWIKEEARI